MNCSSEPIDLWEKYGLSIAEGVHLFCRPDATDAHNLVARYLEEHPEAQAKYKRDQSGDLKYFDVLDLAKAEYLCSEAKDG